MAWKKVSIFVISDGDKEGTHGKNLSIFVILDKNKSLLYKKHIEKISLFLLKTVTYRQSVAVRYCIVVEQIL